MSFSRGNPLHGILHTLGSPWRTQATTKKKVVCSFLVSLGLHESKGVSLTRHGLLLLGDSSGNHVLESEVEGARQLEIEVALVRQELAEINSRRINHNCRDFTRDVVGVQPWRHVGDPLVHDANNRVVDDITDPLAALIIRSRKARINIHMRQGRSLEMKHGLLRHRGHGLRDRDRDHGWHGGHWILLVLSSVVISLLVLAVVALVATAAVAVSATLAVLVVAALAISVVLLVVLIEAALSPFLLVLTIIGLAVVLVVLLLIAI